MVADKYCNYGHLVLVGPVHPVVVGLRLAREYCTISPSWYCVEVCSPAQEDTALSMQQHQGLILSLHRAQAGQVYRWRMVQASTMKWVDLSLNASGCTWGVVARDGILLRDLPRLTDHVVMAAANRCSPCLIYPAPHMCPSLAAPHAWLPRHAHAEDNLIPAASGPAAAAAQ